MGEESRISLGSRLRRERERRNWTQEYLANQLTVSPLSIIRWEKGQARPNTYALQKLIELFGPVEAWGSARTQIWTVPFLRNLYFAGRERVLARLHTILQEQHIVALSQVTTISGLGGIGKTQTAVEYAYRYADEYDFVLWARADSHETLVNQLAELASRLGLAHQADADVYRLAKAVKRRLEEEQQVWLLILDNVDDIGMVKEFLPTRGNGATLLTTRLHAVGKHMRKIALEKLSLEEGKHFLLERAGMTEAQEQSALPGGEIQAAEQLCVLMGGLPLALDQAAAYIEEHQCSLVEYVALYQQQRAKLLGLRNRVDVEDYPDSVATTWLLSFQRIQAQNPATADLLRLCAFLAPDAIPEEILSIGAASLGPLLAPVAADVLLLDQAIEVLRAYSLIKRQTGEKTLSIHRLVQAVLQDEMAEAEKHLWAKRALLAVNAVFPHIEPETWPRCERLLTQALFVTQASELDQVIGEEAGRLLFETATYLNHRIRNAEAEPLYLRSLHIRERLLGLEHPEIARLLSSLGTLYRDLGKYSEAEPFHQKARHILERQLGPEHVEISAILDGLANLYSDQGKYSEAEPLYQRALLIREEQLGPEHPDLAASLNGLAIIYYGQGKYAEAEPLYLRELHILEQQLGPEHHDVGSPLHCLAILYTAQGRYAEAEPLYLRAWRIWEEHLGAEHPRIAATLNCLANLYRKQGKYDEAEPLYLRVLRTFEEHLGPEHPHVADPLTGLATLYRNQQRYTEAEPLYLRALRISEERLGPEHPETADPIIGLADLYNDQGRCAEAESLYQRALKICEQVLGAEHPKTIEVTHTLAQLQKVENRPESVQIHDQTPETTTRGG